MRSSSRSGQLSIGLAAVAAALALGGVASATIPGSAGTYAGCVSRASGVIRMIDPSLGLSSRRAHCLRSENRIAWGSAGATGSPGVTGLQGTAGTDGAPGAAGRAGSAGSAGSAGERGATGGAGTAGDQGSSGTTGSTGAPGANGLAGSTGPSGIPGPGGSAGTVGPPGDVGPAGGTGAAGTSATSAFSGHVLSVASTASGLQRLVFGVPAGLGNTNSAESLVQTLSPSTPITISHLEASETGPPVPVNDQIVVSVRVNGSQAIACVMSAGGTSCDSGSQSANVPAGSTLSIGIQANAALGSTIYGFDLLFGFEATSS